MKPFLLVGVAGVAAAVLGGCSLARVRDVPRGGEILSTEDFIADPTTTPTAAEVATPLAPRDVASGAGDGARASRGSGGLTLPPVSAGPTSPIRIGAADAAAVSAMDDLKVEAGSPEAKAGGGPAVGPPELIDAKVGEINGRAIRVSELLDRFALGRRLDALAKEGQRTRKPRSAWVTESRELVQQTLEGLLQDELLTSEGRASLTAPQKQGLRAFLQEVNENITRTSGGSRYEAQRELAAAGTTEREVVREEEKRVLIEYQLAQKVRNQVNVSWKDVRLYYERNSAEFNPPATAKMRLIRTPADKPEAAAAIASALASGEKFAEVAKRAENTFRRAEGGLAPAMKLEKSFAESELFADRLAPLNAPTQKLSPGQWTGPIDVGQGARAEKVWVYYDELEEIRRPLSDTEVQLEIVDRLTQERRVKATDAYFRRLMERASFTNMDDMVTRVVEIAGERYWPRPR